MSVDGGTITPMIHKETMTLALNDDNYRGVLLSFWYRCQQQILLRLLEKLGKDVSISNSRVHYCGKSEMLWDVQRK